MLGAMIALPPQPADVPWPTDDWPAGALTGADPARAHALIDHAFAGGVAAETGLTHALVIVRGGRLVLERYADGFGPDVTCWSWSMAKSITQALAGIAVLDGRLNVMAPADVAQWRGPGDPRAAITTDLLLRMSSGLKFVESYGLDGVSDVREMLWGAGKDDVAAFAAGFPLEHAPGTWFSYSSGTTNIVARIVQNALGLPDAARFEAFMRERLFAPIGMTSPIPKFDAAGTFIGSSFCFATPRDFARFGLLYLRGGVWDGRRILPEGWADYARTPTWQQPGVTDGAYGAHWWLGLGGPHSFSANGYDGQYICLCPDRDLIIVRHGVTPEGPPREALKSWIRALASSIAPEGT
jgi:CubicO group peptidase (beta-lactamase class C family)